MDIEERYHTLDQDWEHLLSQLAALFGRRPDLNGILFLIGVQELGQGKRNFEKEEKQDLMHIAMCKVLSYSGFYTLEGLDADGWPHWRAEKKVPFFGLPDQEKLLKAHILEYFAEEGLLS
jgi:hypothetical protein